MLAVIYARVSTDEQAQKGLSLPAQVEQCQKYAKEHGMNVTRIFQDEGESATSANRPEFLEMIEYCRASRDISALIVYDTSRFARNREDAVVFKRMLEKKGVKVHYAAQVISDDPEGKFLEGMLEVIDEHYSRALARVVRRGMIESVKRGNWMGSAPFGYRVVRTKEGIRKLEIEPRAAEAVRLIYDLFDQGWGCKKIAEKLHEKGYATTLGKYFRSNNVSCVLKNQAYTGKTVYNRYKQGRRLSKAMLPKEEWILVSDTHEPLITELRFDRIQAELQRRRMDRRPGLLKSRRRFGGMVFCSRCGLTATSQSGTSKDGTVHSYYACGTRVRRSRRLCQGFSVRTEEFENALIGAINQDVFSGKNIETFLSYIKARARELDNGRSGEKIRIQRKLEGVQAKLRRVVLLAEDETIDAEEARRRTKELHAERQDLMERYARLEEELSLKNLIPTRSMIEVARKELQRILAEAEPRMQREFFKRFIKSIRTDGTTADVVYNLGDLVMSVRDNIHVSALGRG